MIWLIYVALTIIFGSARSILQKHILENEQPSEYLGLRGIALIIISALFIPWMNFNISSEAYLICFTAGVLLGLSAVLKNTGVKKMKLSHFSPLWNFNLIFITIFSIIFLNETLNFYQILGILILLTGVYLLELEESTSLTKPFKVFFSSQAMGVTLIGMVLISVVGILDRYALSVFNIESFTYLFMVWSFMTLTLIVFDLIDYGYEELKTTMSKDWKEIVIASIITLLTVATFYKAVSLAYIAIVVSLTRLRSLLTTIVGGLVFHEENLENKVFESIIIVTGAILIVVA